MSLDLSAEPVAPSRSTASAAADGASTTSTTIGKASMVLSVATLGASAANYALNLLLARWMSPAEFGDANLIVTLMLGITAVAVTLQLVAARRTSTGDPAQIAVARRDLLRRAWLVGIAVAVPTAAFSPLLRDVTSSGAALPFALLALGLPCYLAQAVERGGLQGRLRFGALAGTLIVEAATRLIVAVLLVAAGFGVSGATAGITASFFATWLVARRNVRIAQAADGIEHHSDPHGVATTPTGRITDRHAAQAAAFLLVGQIIVNNGDVVLAKLLFDAEAAGIYSVVALIGRAIFFLSWSVVTAAFPIIATAPDHECVHIERRAVRTVAAMSTVMTLGVALLAPPLTPLVFGAEYASAGALFAPYAIATSLFAVANVRATLGAARGSRRPALIVIAGGTAQAALLASFAGNPSQMVWLQVVAMSALLVAVAILPTRDTDEGRATHV